MINVIFFTSVLLSCLPCLHSATDGKVSMPICPESFSCPGLAAFSYPFYNGTDNRCGLIKVICTDNETIQLGGRSYVILGRSDFRPTVLIHNTTLGELVEAESCEALMNNITSPSPLLFSISVTPFITVFKCTKNHSSAQQNDAYFDQPNYNSYNICKDHNFYYKYSVSNATVPNDLPLTCQVIHLPLKARWQISGSDGTNIFSLISPSFSVTFNLTPSCDKCHQQSGHCHTNNGQFQCLDAKNVAEKPRREMILILVLVGFALVLLLCPVIFLIRRCYKNPFSYSSSKQKSTNLEDGSCFFGVSVFSYSELEDATKNFDPSHELGDGGFGAVYYGKLKDGREVAVKRLYDHNFKRVQQYMNEVDILTRLRHPNLVVLYGCTSRQSRELLLVYEYIPNGTVAHHLHGDQDNPSLLKWPIRMKIAIETATALAYLHASEIIHRDVKTSNILLDLNFCVKVADFGLSRLIPDNATHVSTAPQGTPGYLDPQYHQRYQLTEKSDVYSFGVVLIELISSMVAVDLSRSHDEIGLANLALNMIQRSAINLLIDPVLVSESDSETINMITSVAELAFQCLQFDSEVRPTMNEVLNELMEIQAGEGIDTHESMRDLTTVNQPTQSETKDVVALLKDFPPSPVSVTREWQSDSSASTTLSSSKGLGDRLALKNSIST